MNESKYYYNFYYSDIEEHRDDYSRPIVIARIGDYHYGNYPTDFVIELLYPKLILALYKKEDNEI